MVGWVEHMEGFLGVSLMMCLGNIKTDKSTKYCNQIFLSWNCSDFSRV